VAHVIHTRSPRSSGPLVKVNCASIPHELFESEFFGHVKGAFTGAVRDRVGRFQLADGGTIFLDEVGEIPLDLQSKLLRVLQESEYERVGDDHTHAVDVRVIAATNQSLMDAVRAGRFRLDLLTRLEGLSVRVPSLAERRTDIPELYLHFLRQALEARGQPEPPWLLRDVNLFAPPVPFGFWRSLIGRRWIGNVRQLERAAIATATLSLARGAFVPPDLEPDSDRASGSSDAGAAPARRRQSREELEHALEQHDWVQHRVARALDIPQATLSRWIQEYGILRPSELEGAAVEAALDAAGGDLGAAASTLRVSARGLRLRITELGLQDRLRKKGALRGKNRP
jgi:transcriptional regulator with GAF, ATPase, and Fis domain